VGAFRQVAALCLVVPCLVAPWLVAAGFALTPVSASAASCAEIGKIAGTRLTEGGTVLVVRFPDGKVKVGQPFAVELIACAADGRPVRFARVDAWMPAHGHGMNYRPTKKTLGDGHRRYDGFLFHMPGTWELRADIVTDNGRARFRLPIKVGP
jgi:hypothetical protein